MSRLTTADFPSRSMTQVEVSNNEHSIALKVLVDSGADANLMDWGLAKRLKIASVPLTQTLEASALDGTLMCKVTHRTMPLKITIDHEHSEYMTFHLFNSAQHAVILGYPWLCKHNPHIDWRTGKVLGWGSECSHSCFRSKTAEIVREPIIDNDREHEDNQDSDFPDLSNVPSCYRDLKEVFNKTKATSLPPHRTYDCAIDLLPGSPLPKGRLYSLSAPERESMREYIDGSLKTGLIRPSSSPAGAGFFFVEKKDGSLRPCIDYSPLNDITIKNRYPLPLMTSAFELLKGARVFSKLDLRNTYHLVRIREGDEWKTGFNTPSGHYEYLVMPFGLTNAPAVFQALINDVLREFLNHFVFVYLDDILIFFFP